MNKKKKTKPDLNKRNDKAKYTDDEIERKKRIDTIVKLIIRDRIPNDVINTSKKWVAVNDTKYTIKRDHYGNETYDIQEADVELFNKKDVPKYTKFMSEEEKHELTYITAENDIFKQRIQGFKGQEYRIKVHTKKVNGKNEIIIDDLTRIDIIKKKLKKSKFDVTSDNIIEIVDIYCSSKDRNQFRKKLIDAKYDENFVEEQVKQYNKD